METMGILSVVPFLITYSLIEKGTTDKIPIVSIGYGRTDASDGRVFPYVFPLMTNYWSQNTAKIKFIGMKEGGMDKLKGKKIVNIYHDSADRKSTRLNSSHSQISYAVFCLKKKKKKRDHVHESHTTNKAENACEAIR